MIPRTAPTTAASLLVGFALLFAACSRESSAPRVATAKPPDRIDFNAHVRPILNTQCTACHGGVKAAGGISFVFREDALRKGESGKLAIVPGKPDDSELIRRITSTDPDYRMPHVDHGPPLPKEQIALLRQWIAEGAEWAEHWAFIPPKPQTPPPNRHPSWSASPVDRFVLARLEREGLTPSPRADKATLLRRLSFDLTGLPPTLEELEAFEADNEPDAWERQVDRLLASPHYGERWASLWLDLARYADTKGYERDPERTGWAHRDWLVRALNRNQPYDQFMIEQLAGDLIPGASLEQRIATGFHRHTQTNDEAGSDDEEFRVAAVLDRVGTTWSVLNGVTFNCIQCHSHPYDPIRHEEYFRFLAFFNTSRDADFFHEYPNLLVPDDLTRFPEAAALEDEKAALLRDLAARARALSSSAPWVAAPISAASATPAATFRLVAGEAFAEGTVATKAAFDLTFSAPALPGPLTALRLEVPPLDADKARHTPEIGFLVSKVEAWLVGPDGKERPLPFARLVADEEETPAPPLARLVADEEETPAPPLVRKPAAPAYPPAAANAPANTAATPAPTPAAAPEVPTAFGANPALDRPRWAILVLGEPITLPPDTRLRLRISHGRGIAQRPAPVRRIRISATHAPVSPSAEDEDRRKRLDAVISALTDLPGTYLPVMAEQPEAERRETRLYVRGNWMDKAGPPLEPGVPALFPPLPEGAPRNRLTLARWFFADDQPLTARAAVNRYWEQLFGIGIVETLEDYGSVGEPPSHPELLDWLARHFQFDLQWDVKALLRTIVLSETYRQSAHASPAARERDPRNRLLARGPRNRLTAEMIRDQALLASGLLDRKLGGPPVMPFQPAGIWQTPYNGKDWVMSEGGDRYRRALYTFWKRTSAYPSFLSFDAATRDVCTVRRVPTNTPLQALVLLNDPVYDEAGRALAGRIRRDLGPDSGPDTWIRHGWRLVMGRPPIADDLASLQRLYRDARALAPADTPAVDADAGALVAVASALLNLDLALTK